MLFGVRDKEWDITFVNNYCREQYQEMLDAVDEIADLPAEVDEVSDDESVDRKEKIKRIKELRVKQRALVRKIADIREDIVRELLETNGHEYDKTWWSRKADADDMNTFALGCLQKDVKAGNTAKKK